MHLTALEIFTTACSYISQTVEDSEDIIGFAPAWLNVLLAECLETENTLRRMDGQAELEEAPRVSGETMNMEIPYHDALTRIALPYGLASEVYRDADDNYRVKKFRDLYIAALEEAVRGEAETVVDSGHLRLGGKRCTAVWDRGRRGAGVLAGDAGRAVQRR